MNKQTLIPARCSDTRFSITAGCLLAALLTLTGCDQAINDHIAAKEKAKANEVARQEAKAAAEAINYDALDFTKLEALEKSESQLAQIKRDDDSRVHYAWHGVITNLLAVRGEVDRQIKILQEADILNVGTITNGSQRKVSQQFIDRRGMANRYGDALYSWEHALQTIDGSYSTELHKFQVSSERAGTEWDTFRKLLSDPLHTGLKDRINQELAICAAEKEIASQYNYAVSSMEMYYQRRQSIYGNASPQTVPTRQLPWEVKTTGADSIVNDAREEFQEKVAKLEQLKKSAQQLRDQRASPKPSGQVATK